MPGHSRWVSCHEKAVACRRGESERRFREASLGRERPAAEDLYAVSNRNIISTSARQLFLGCYEVARLGFPQMPAGEADIAHLAACSGSDRCM